MQCLSVIAVGGPGVHYQVVFIIHRILYITGYLHYVFYNDDAPAVPVSSTDLFAGRTI